MKKMLVQFISYRVKGEYTVYLYNLRFCINNNLRIISILAYYHWTVKIIIVSSLYVYILEVIDRS